ncbi:MAG: hypothetical protein ACE5J1_05970, partial [Nitrospiria bacterium]
DISWLACYEEMNEERSSRTTRIARSFLDVLIETSKLKTPPRPSCLDSRFRGNDGFLNLSGTGFAGMTDFDVTVVIR